MGALVGRSETGSETERVGSGMKRTTAKWRADLERPLSARPCRFSGAVLCLSGFRAVQESRTVKAPGILSDEWDEPCDIILLGGDELVFAGDLLRGSQDMLDLGALHTFGKSPAVRPA